MSVNAFEKRLNAYKPHPRFFIHRSCVYKPRKEGQGVKKQWMPTIGGLVFLQGSVRELQTFLSLYFPSYHLVNNCSTGKPASIADGVMQSFMQIMNLHPEKITFLRDPFVKFARNHVKLRVLTGPFKGQEGYVVRVDRDRQLVMDFGGYAVAIRGVHKENFEVVE